MVDGALVMVRQQILLAYIRDVTAFRIFGEQMIKGLVFSRPDRLRYRLIPFFAVTENRVDIKYHAAKVKDAVPDDITNGKGGFCYFWCCWLFDHMRNIMRYAAQINLVAWQIKKHRLMAPLCHWGAPVFRH